MPILAKSNGAVVGVSGAILDVAAFRKSQLIVSVDVNPSVGRSLLFFAVVLLAVDVRVGRRGWSPKRRLAEVRRRLSGTVSPFELFREFESFGLSRGIQKDLRSVCYPIIYKFRAMGDGHLGWCSGNGASARVMHLTRLARDARILSVTSELGSSAVAAIANAQADKLNLDFDHIHLSNTFEYSPRLSAIFAEVSKLRMSRGASVTLSAQHFHRIRKRLIPEVAQFVKRWGTFKRPASISAKRFLASGKSIEQSLWKDRTCRLHWARDALRTMHPPLLKRLTRIPKNQRQLDALVDDAFRARADTRRQWVVRALKRHGYWEGYGELLSHRQMAKLTPQAPKHPNEVLSSAAAFNRRFWTAARKREKLKQLLRARGLRLKSAEPVDERLVLCQSLEDLLTVSRDEVRDIE